MLGRLLIALSVMIVFAVTGAVSAQCTPTEHKVTASDSTELARFGESVSISGDVAIVGVNEGEFLSIGAGSAYIFRFDGTNWTEEQKLTASDAAADDHFGRRVSISGNVAVAGAASDDDFGSNTGSAYVYRFNGTTWIEEQKLTASDGEGSDFFGSSVSISGETVFVGAVGEDAAYVYAFDGTNWVEEQKLKPPTVGTGDAFGSAISFTGDLAFIGAPFDNNVGSAYVFEFDGTDWVEQQKLIASNPGQGDQFGSALSIGGDFAVVGAFSDDDEGISAGAAYVFGFNGTDWAEEQKLTASDAGPSQQFGLSVANRGDLLLVGSVGGNGSVYMFSPDGTSWVEQSQLQASDGEAADNFGWSISISGDRVLTGAMGDKDNGGFTGSAYFVDLASCQPFVRGDANGDGAINLADPIDTLDYLFSGGSTDCLRAIDANGDGLVNLPDVITLVSHLFQAAGPLPAPFPDCAPENASSGLSCNAYSCP